MRGVFIKDRRGKGHRDAGKKATCGQRQILGCHIYGPRTTKNCQQMPEARREVRMNSPSEAPDETNSGDILSSDFWTPEL